MRGADKEDRAAASVFGYVRSSQVNEHLVTALGYQFRAKPGRDEAANHVVIDLTFGPPLDQQCAVATTYGIAEG
jgi:hypothetical protein